VETGSFTHLLAQAIMVLVPMVLSLTVHEYAHALVAKRLGDDTASGMGRLSLNPLAHADPVGTFGLPLMILLANGAIGGGAIPFFGWAKPVPVNPGRFSRKVTVRTGMMLVALAGPVSNLLIALVCAGVFSASLHGGFYASIPEGLTTFLGYMLRVNIALFVFNMIPVYPLDGQKVVSGLLSAQNAIRFERFNYQFGTFMLLGLIVFARDIIVYPVLWVSHGVLLLVGLPSGLL
jgi:Zn-dependent protease